MDCDYLLKFLALGDSGVGKTSFLGQYTDGQFDPRFRTTIGIDFKEKRVFHESADKRRYEVRLQLWDTAGQEKYRSLTAAFYRESMGFFLLFDLTNEQSFLAVRNWLDQLREFAYYENPEVILCGNKSDLEDRRIINEEKARDFASEHNLVYLETSAATGQNVKRAVDILLERVMRRIDSTVDQLIFPHQHPSHNQIKFHEPKSPAKEKSSCFC